MLLAGTSLLIGCASMGVIKTNDPYRKLSDAYDLIWNQQRPLPADSLILEAMEIFRKSNDEKGLALAYTRYAELLGSPAAKIFVTTNFQDGTPKEKRFDRSVEYLKLAKELSVKLNDYESLANQEFKTALAYENIKKVSEACAAYTATAEAMTTYQRNVPNAQVNFPPSYRSFNEYVEAQKKRLSCP